jgi:hypothetical protein
MRKYIFFFFIFINLLIFAPEVSAQQVVINEFSSSTTSDWVELYNPTDSPVDLSAYILRDSTDSNKRVLSGTLDPGNVLVLDFSRWLNNGGDLVRLMIVSGEEESVEDSILYGEGGICLPSESGSIGRLPGAGAVVRFSINTKNSLNKAENEDPCPTLTPIPTATSTESPTPSPTLTSTPKPTATAVATKKPTSTPEVIGVETTNDDISDLREGLKPDEPEEEEETKKKFPLIAGLFLFGGVVLIGFASFSFLKNNKKEYNNRGEKGGFKKIGFKRDNF